MKFIYQSICLFIYLFVCFFPYIFIEANNNTQAMLDLANGYIFSEKNGNFIIDKNGKVKPKDGGSYVTKPSSAKTFFDGNDNDDLIVETDNNTGNITRLSSYTYFDPIYSPTDSDRKYPKGYRQVSIDKVSFHKDKRYVDSYTHCMGRTITNKEGKIIHTCMTLDNTHCNKYKKEYVKFNSLISDLGLYKKCMELQNSLSELKKILSSKDILNKNKKDLDHIKEFLSSKNSTVKLENIDLRGDLQNQLKDDNPKPKVGLRHDKKENRVVTRSSGDEKFFDNFLSVANAMCEKISAYNDKQFSPEKEIKTNRIAK